MGTRDIRIVPIGLLSGKGGPATGSVFDHERGTTRIRAGLCQTFPVRLETRFAGDEERRVVHGDRTSEECGAALCVDT